MKREEPCNVIVILSCSFVRPTCVNHNHEHFDWPYYSHIVLLLSYSVLAALIPSFGYNRSNFYNRYNHNYAECTVSLFAYRLQSDINGANHSTTNQKHP